jgi:molybdopterin adenylyltransferase
MPRTAIITISDSTVAGTREDRSGPALAVKVGELGWTICNKLVLPDEEELIAKAISELADSGELDLILTTGGSGLAPREIPGFGELMRSEGLKSTKFAPLSRGGASTRGSVLIVNVPGSPKGAVESLMAVAHLVPHVVELLHGRTEHK